MDPNLHQNALEAGKNAASITMASGTVASLYGGYSATEIAAFGGLFIAILGFLWKLYVDRQLIRIAEMKAEHDAKLNELAVKGFIDRRNTVKERKDAGISAVDAL